MVFVYVDFLNSAYQFFKKSGQIYFGAYIIF